MLAALSHAELGTTFLEVGHSIISWKGLLDLFIVPPLDQSIQYSRGNRCTGLATTWGTLCSLLSWAVFCSWDAKEMFGIGYLVVLGNLNARGVKEVTWFQTFQYRCEMTVLGFISVTGIVLLVRGRRENPSQVWESFRCWCSGCFRLLEPSYKDCLHILVGESLS